MAPKLAATKTAGRVSPTQQPVRQAVPAKSRPQLVTPGRLFVVAVLAIDVAGVIAVQADPAKSPLYAGLAAAAVLASAALLPQYGKYRGPVRARAWLQAILLVAALTARGTVEGAFPASWVADQAHVSQPAETVLWVGLTAVVLVRLFVRSFAAADRDA